MSDRVSLRGISRFTESGTVMSSRREVWDSEAKRSKKKVLSIGGDDQRTYAAKVTFDS